MHIQLIQLLLLLDKTISVWSNADTHAGRCSRPWGRMVYRSCLHWHLHKQHTWYLCWNGAVLPWDIKPIKCIGNVVTRWSFSEVQNTLPIYNRDQCHPFWMKFKSAQIFKRLCNCNRCDGRTKFCKIRVSNGFRWDMLHISKWRQRQSGNDRTDARQTVTIAPKRINQERPKAKLHNVF